MSSLSNDTADINIPQPEQWKMSLRFEEKGLRFVTHSDAVSNSLISRMVEFDKNRDDYLSMMENCIYDNPFFLQDFKRVSISVESMQFLLLPMEYETEESVTEVFKAVYPNFEGDILTSPVAGCDVNIVYGVKPGVKAFLNRTFSTPSIRHHLTVLCEYFMRKSEQSGMSKEYVYIHDNKIDVCVFCNGRITFANSFNYRAVEDAAFFILNVWQTHNLDVMSDELQIIGDKVAREAVTPILRKYITYVMPVIFPAAAMGIGQDAVKAPFDLILLSLCE